ncbi:MAG: hypothetical protein C4520_17805 [Candidatus Abyssobacteria bacterium SURF_5]|uniref:MobA-like NTP transferase domain-containing protein n=1 Tax=Abyssobacteria bacterium (strain SURF_5) TaxID=2093360 RepID=A0A3A4N559_ABYX5|nr:MAG: hypothetical protein C4520_17805 [Candidatus Abyssubacteria bacterium SURF_5]
MNVKMKGVVAVLIFLSLSAAGISSMASLPASEDTGRPDGRVVAILFSVWQTEDAKKHFRDVPNLDLLEVNGKPMIEHVYDALRSSRHVDKIVVFAAPEVERRLKLTDDPGTSFIEDRGDAAANLQFGVGEVEKGDLVMFIPSDLALVTSEGLDELIDRVLDERSVDLVFPLVSRQQCERQYPEEARTYGHFREGQFTGAHVEFLRPDLFLDNPDEVRAQKDNLYNLYYMRKSTLGAARFLGVKLTLKYVFGSLSIQDLERHVLEKYEVTAKAILWDDADLATDLSEPSDVQMISRALQQRAAAQLRTPPARGAVSGRS